MRPARFGRALESSADDAAFSQAYQVLHELSPMITRYQDLTRKGPASLRIASFG